MTGRYLLKSSNLDTRLRVEIILLNKTKDKVLMGFNTRLNKFVFPGGGLDPEETLDVAAKRECLEESGYKCKNLLILGKGPYFSKDGQEATRWISATEDGIDKSVYGADKDQMEIQKWYTFNELEQELLSQDNMQYTDMNLHRIERVREAILGHDSYIEDPVDNILKRLEDYSKELDSDMLLAKKRGL